MPWTTPPTFTADTELAAADLNLLSDDLEYLKGIADGVTFSGAKVDRAGASAVSVANTTETAITLTNEVFDFGGWWSSGATFTVPAGAIPAGYTTIAVMVNASIRFAANGTGLRKLIVLKNGSEIDHFGAPGLVGEVVTVAGLTVFTVEAADTIGIQAYQSSGGALNLDVARLTVLRYAPAS